MKTGILKDDRLADGSASAPAGTALAPLAATGDFPTGEGSRRLRILEGWASAVQSRLTAVYAPLGFGKTTLLQQMKQAWLRAGGTCFHLDGDLARDGESLAGFLQGAADRMFSDPPDALMSSSEIDAREIVSRIAGRLDANDVRLLVLLDGYDRLSTARNNEILRLCIKAFPDHTRFVISSRNRVRSLSSEIASSFLEIGPNELRLMPCEIAAFLGEPQGSARAEQVFKWTGGWPLAVKLANPFMSLTETEAGEIGDVARHNRADVAGILAGEVLKNLPRAHHDALLKSAFLDKFHPDLLGDALDVEHSWRICEELERDYFLISRQDGSDWYETHPFIQRAAYRRLRATPGVSLVDLQKQAARWLERKGDLQAALRLAVMAEAFDDAVQMVLDAGGVFLALRKGFDTLKAALSLLPRERRQGVERLILCEAIVMTREGRLALAADLVAGVKARIRLAAREQDDPYLHRDLAYAEVSIGYLSGTRVGREAIDTLQHALDSFGPEDCWLRGPVHRQLAATHYRTGALRKALQHLEMARHYLEAGNAPHAIAHNDLFAGEIRLEMGETATAIEHYQRALEQFTHGSAICNRGRAIAHAHLAEVFAEVDQLDRALEHLEPCAEVLAAGETLYEYKVAAAHAQSLITAKMQGTAAAIDLLRRHEDMAHHCQLPDVARFLALRRLQLQLSRRDVATRVSEHAVLAVQLQADRCFYSQRERDMVDITRAWMALADGAEMDALRMLEAQLPVCVAEGARKHEMQIHLMMCTLNEAVGRREAALDALGAAIAVGAETGLRRLFDELGSSGPTLFKHFIASRMASLSDAETEFVGGLIARDPILNEARGGLTERELEVFRLVGAGRSNKLIARDLAVSPATVRYHLKNVYEKLGTHERRVVRQLAQASE